MQLFKECLILLICALTCAVLGITLLYLTPLHGDNKLLAAIVWGFFATIGLTIGHLITNKYMS